MEKKKQRIKSLQKRATLHKKLKSSLIGKASERPLNIYKVAGGPGEFSLFGTTSS